MFGVGILQCSPGMLWSSLVQRVFSMCAVVSVSSLGLANFAVVGGWFESGFRRARWTNPPPSPNGEGGASQTGPKPQKGGDQYRIAGEKRKTRIN